MICEFLLWDTEFFGLRIGRVNQHYLTRASIRDILEWEKTNLIDCLYFLAEFDDPATLQLAQAHHFKLVDIRLTLECELNSNRNVPDAAGKAIIRPVQPKDISSLEAIARKSHADTRFHFDQNFPRDKSDSLYGIWIRRSCEGWADPVLVADVNSQVVGYIACKVLNEACGHISLVGVGEQARGKGIGKTLVNAALDWFAARDLHSVQVVTQGRNISAQRLYQKCGFSTRSLQLWYHRWTHITGTSPG